MALLSVILCLIIIIVAAAGAILVIVRLENVNQPRFWGKKLSSESTPLNPQSEFDIRAPGKILDEELWHCCHGALSPGWLLLYRTLAFLYTLYVMFVCYSRLGITTGYLWYTVWCYTLLCIYFGVATFASAKGCYKLFRNEFIAQQTLRLIPESANIPPSVMNVASLASQDLVVNVAEPGAKEVGVFGHIMQIMYQIALPMALLVDLVLWCILFPLAVQSGTTSHILNFLGMNQHVGNLLLISVEFLLNSMRFPSFRVGYTILWSGCYVLFQWTVHYTFHLRWPYPFLDNEEATAPIWYFSLMMFHLVVYFLWCGLNQLKQRYYPSSTTWVAALQHEALHFANVSQEASSSPSDKTYSALGSEVSNLIKLV